MVDRVEVGEAGAFDQCKTIEDCVRLMLMDQAPSEAPKLVAIIGAEIERQAGPTHLRDLKRPAATTR